MKIYHFECESFGTEFTCVAYSAKEAVARLVAYSHEEKDEHLSGVAKDAAFLMKGYVLREYDLDKIIITEVS